MPGCSSSSSAADMSSNRSWFFHYLDLSTMCQIFLVGRRYNSVFLIDICGCYRGNSSVPLAPFPVSAGVYGGRSGPDGRRSSLRRTKGRGRRACELAAHLCPFREP